MQYDVRLKLAQFISMDGIWCQDVQPLCLEEGPINKSEYLGMFSLEGLLGLSTLKHMKVDSM